MTRRFFLLCCICFSLIFVGGSHLNAQSLHPDPSQPGRLTFLTATCAAPLDCSQTACAIGGTHAIALFGPNVVADAFPPLKAVTSIIEPLLPEMGLLPLIANRFNLHREKLSSFEFGSEYRVALAELTTSLSANSISQAAMMGQLMDAKDHLEAEQSFAELQIDAYKDYKPSESFCAIGTNTRALAMTNVKRKFTNNALNQLAFKEILGVQGTASANSGSDALLSRFTRFTQTNCDKRDNNYIEGSDQDSGLEQACSSAANEAYRINRDIDYTRFIDFPRSLDIDLSDGTATPDEEDFFAFSDNIFSSNPLSRNIRFGSDSGNQRHMAQRSVMARRAVAQNSINAIVAMKSAGTTSAGDPDQTYKYLAAILSDLGVRNDEIASMIGQRPSYYAQLEVLSKKMMQSPNFYTWLIDKEANVKRKEAALNGIELMLDRALFESELRQELVMSVLLASALGDDLDEVSQELGRN